jgi:hypothetical protein
MNYNPSATATILAFALALGLSARMYSQHNGFSKVVHESLLTSEGYDQKFIDLVNHLEDVLTTRASFPYPGGKDPMTGRRREVAVMEVAPRRAVPVQRSASAKPAPALRKAEQDPDPKDRVRLTAIIADDYGQHTAIVMDGERSLSVDIGDSVGDRKVIRITGRELTMEDASTVYTYGLTGTRTQVRK